MIQKIKSRIEELKRLAIEKSVMSERTRHEIEAAVTWISEGCISRYSNHDFDILNGLTNCLREYQK